MWGWTPHHLYPQMKPSRNYIKSPLLHAGPFKESPSSPDTGRPCSTVFHRPWVHTSCNWHYYSNPGCSHFRRGFFTLSFSAWFGIDRRYLPVGADQYHLMYFHMNFCSVCLAKFLWLAACWPINVSSVLSSPPWDSRSTDLCSIITTIL